MQLKLFLFLGNSLFDAEHFTLIQNTIAAMQKGRKLRFLCSVKLWKSTAASDLRPGRYSDARRRVLPLQGKRTGTRFDF